MAVCTHGTAVNSGLSSRVHGCIGAAEFGTAVLYVTENHSCTSIALHTAVSGAAAPCFDRSSHAVRACAAPVRSRCARSLQAWSSDTQRGHLYQPIPPAGPLNRAPVVAGFAAQPTWDAMPTTTRRSSQRKPEPEPAQAQEQQPAQAQEQQQEQAQEQQQEQQ